MDYLKIISRRSLLIFGNNTSSSSQDDDSPPTTPTSTLSPPRPIAIPISNLIGNDSRIFFFLQQHILRRPDHLTSREERTEAEVMVWRELAKAGTFLRELGLAVARGELGKAGLREVARKCGLGLVSVVKKDSTGRISSGKKQSLGLGYTGCGSEGSQNGEKSGLMA